MCGPHGFSQHRVKWPSRLTIGDVFRENVALFENPHFLKACCFQVEGGVHKLKGKNTEIETEIGMFDRPSIDLGKTEIMVAMKPRRDRCIGECRGGGGGGWGGS